jgi:hypothetical protein
MIRNNLKKILMIQLGFCKCYPMYAYIDVEIENLQIIIFKIDVCLKASVTTIIKHYYLLFL